MLCFLTFPVACIAADIGLEKVHNNEVHNMIRKKTTVSLGTFFSQIDKTSPASRITGKVSINSKKKKTVNFYI